jgi:hypothetical protein
MIAILGFFDGQISLVVFDGVGKLFLFIPECFESVCFVGVGEHAVLVAGGYFGLNLSRVKSEELGQFEKFADRELNSQIAVMEMDVLPHVEEEHVEALLIEAFRLVEQIGGYAHVLGSLRLLRLVV